jgi:hypothetical protein
MAEQVRLRETLTPLRVPRVSFAGAEAQARGLGNLAQSLSRMSNFVAQQAESKAVIEGAEYGARNAPTAKQIEEAAADGASLELPGDQTTVYGKAVRKAALSIASDEITALASDKVTRINSIFNAHLEGTMSEAQEAEALSGIGINDFSVDSFATALDTVAAGYGAVLDEQSPAVARKFRAEMGISNNAIWSKYLDKYVKKQDEKLEFSARDAHQKTFTVPKIGALLETADGNKAIDSLRAVELSKMSPHLSGSEVKTFLDNMDGTIKDAATKIVADGTFATDRPTNTIGLISQGKVTNLPLAVRNGIKELRDQGMSFTDIGKALREERNAQINFSDAEQKLANDQSQRNEPGAIALVRKSMASGNRGEFDANIKVLAGINPEKAQELTDEFNNAGRIRTVSDTKITEVVQNLAAADDLSFDDIDKFAPGLSLEDQRKLSDLVDSQESQELAAAKDILSAFDLPPTYTVISDNDPNFEKAQIARRGKAELTRRFQEAKSKGLDFDGIGIADTIAKNISEDFKTVEIKLKRNDANKTVVIINSLQQALKQAGRAHTIFADDDYQGVLSFLKRQKTLPDSERIKGLKEIEAIDAQIKKIQTYLDTQE